MPRLIVLGNCVAERLSLLLAGLLRKQHALLPSLGEEWQAACAPPVFNIAGGEELRALFSDVKSCDLVFSQPLFSFGDLNTENLRKALGSRLRVFSAPNFEAYFPDVMDIRPYREPEKFPPPLEWHSKIIVMCKAAGVPAQDIESVYLHHPLFKRASIQKKVAESLARYEKRDSGVDIGTYDFVRVNWAALPLFHTFNHPADPLLRLMLSGMLEALGAAPADIEAALERVPWTDNPETGEWSEWGFGFNSWPIITRGHDLFSFPGRESFRVGGKDVDITACAIAWHRYYDQHPLIFQQALEAANAGWRSQ